MKQLRKMLILVYESVCSNMECVVSRALRLTLYSAGERERLEKGGGENVD